MVIAKSLSAVVIRKKASRQRGATAGEKAPFLAEAFAVAVHRKLLPLIRGPDIGMVGPRVTVELGNIQRDEK